jgi:hypothetical protein
VEHDLSENRSPLFRIMLMDGRFARPRFSFACAWKRGGQRERDAASLLPHSASKTRVNALMGEKDRMREFGPRSLILNLPNLLTQPSPLWGEGTPSFCGLSWQAFPFSRRVSAPEFFLRAIGKEARASKIRSREARNRSGPRKGQGWGLLFVRPVRRFRRFVAWIERSEIRERRSGAVAAPGFRSAQPGLRNK